LIDDKWRQLAVEIETQIMPVRRRIEETVELNQAKVLRAFQAHRVSDFHFAASSGYGYNDRGREVIDLMYASVFGVEQALVRPHFVSGTHAIAVALFGVLRPGDELVFITGKPYDTLQKVVGAEPNANADADTDPAGRRGHSLFDWGIRTTVVDLTAQGEVDETAVRRAITAKTRVVAIQRSRGYEWRSSFSIAHIAAMVRFLRTIREDLIIFVDNCYGEFTEADEPTNVGVDLCAGSLIKNPGGGIASTGGYIVGRKVYVEMAAERLTAPGIGGEVGAMLDTSKAILQGLFLAPHTVGQALQGAVFGAALFARCGLATNPAWDVRRTDLIQAVKFHDAHSLLRFVQSIQHASPVDSHVTPEPWDMPGYEHPVVMAAGTFVQGGSLELTADAPMREPYIAYLQGGLTYAHAKIALLTSASQLFGHSFDK
jgi:cystathionine beta-lyase family protein involved in aluminum resistance